MNGFENIVVTEIVDVMTVISPKGKCADMKNRKSYGLSFCEEGQITYIHKGRKFISDSKHIIILPEGQDYSLKGDKTGVFPLVNFKCRNVLCDTFLLFPINDISPFMSDFKKIKELILFPENRIKAMSVFYNMLYNLTREGMGCDIITPALKYIEKNYSEQNLTNKTLADVCNISEVYLRKLFVKHLKTTPKQYICEIRLQKAKQLLSEGVLKINAVSEECGFSSCYHFSRFFKKQTGVTPAEYSTKNRIHKI